MLHNTVKISILVAQHPLTVQRAVRASNGAHGDDGKADGNMYKGLIHRHYVWNVVLSNVEVIRAKDNIIFFFLVYKQVSIIEN
jgi:hypothetical protein